MMKPRLRTWCRRLLIAAALLVVAWLGTSAVVAYRLTRRAEPPHEEPLPTVAWATFEPLRLTTSDGQQIGGWFAEGRADRPAVLLLHGNGGSRASCLPEAEWLVAARYPVLLITLRAHGDSTGDVNDFGYSARHDVLSAVAWWESRHPDRHLIVWGKSLGAAAAVFAAGELGQRVQGYVLECLYQDLHTAVWNRLQMRLHPGLRPIAYAGLCAAAPLVLADSSKISPLSAVTTIPPDIPVLILAGEKDRHALPAESKAICKRIESHAKVAVFTGAEHLQLAATNPVMYRQLVLDFIARCDEKD
ncbi:MAG: alpha/beta fold hydrolase [Planctomycetia bacterium]|nr:alpha/beta fold hydrolase [Planctomycetia bacterium]